MGRLRSFALAFGILQGCTLANMTPQARFQDAAYTLNDAARWGQVDLASKYVAPAYMDSFLSRHRDWGSVVSIADADLVRMKIADDRNTATSTVALHWYSTHGISVRNSVIAQQWEAVRGHFRLVSESLQAGDPGIFAANSASEDSGGSATP